MSALLHRLGVSAFLPDPVHTYNTLLLGISIMCGFSARETEAYCIAQTLSGSFRAPLEQTCPLFENHCSR